MALALGPGSGIVEIAIGAWEKGHLCYEWKYYPL